MNKLADPGKGLSREQAKAERLKAWKRPRLIKDRQTLRDERIQAWEARYGSISHIE